MSKGEIYLAVATAALSFLGAVGGTALSSYLGQRNWEMQAYEEQKRIVLQKRVDLLEKTVFLFNENPTLKGLRGSLDYEKQMALVAVYCAAHPALTKKKGSDCASMPKTNIEHTEKVAKEMYELNAQLMSTLTLDGIYFGPDTQKAIQALRKTDIWSEDSGQRQRVIDAMGREVNWFPK